MAYDLRATLKLADEFTRPVRDALRAFDTMDRSIRDMDSSWRDIQSSARRATDEIRQFGDQTRNSAQDAGGLQDQLNDARRQAERLGEAGNDLDTNLGRAGETGRTAGGKIGTAFAAVAGIVGTIVAVDQVKDLLVSMVEAAGAAKATEAQFSEVFGDLEGEASKKLGAIGDEATILENRMKGSFTKIAAFAKTGGMETADALDLADRSMRVIADSAAFYDRSLEDTTESLQSFLKGNFENDAALGLSATETTRNAAATELYGKKFKDLDEAQKQLTLLDMVEDANKVGGAMGQAARESDGLENVLGNVQQAWTDLKAAMGEPVLEVAVEGMKWLTEKLQDVDGEKLAGGIKGAIVSIAATFDAIRNNPAILWMQETLPVVMETVKTAMLNAFQSETVGGAIAGITGFLSSMKDIGQQLWDFFISMGPGVSVIFNDLWIALQPIFNALGVAFNLIGDIVSTVFNTIVLPLLKLTWGAFQILWGIVSPILKLLGIGIEVTFAYLELAWREVVKPVLTWIGEKFTETYEIAKPALDGIKSYVDMVRDSFDTLMGRVDDFVGKIKGIEIPSWVTNGVSAVGNFFSPLSIDGSHATGLAKVKKNGYIAELHANEAVLTANQANTLRGMGVLQSSGDKPVLDASALAGKRTGTGQTITRSTNTSAVNLNGVTINVNGHTKPTKEIAREILTELQSRIAGGVLA